MDSEEAPASNPLPPPPRTSVSSRRERERERAPPSFANLSNTDFRKMVMETPRGGTSRGSTDQKQRRPKKSEEGDEEEEDRSGPKGGGGGRRGRGGGGGGGGGGRGIEGSGRQILKEGEKETSKEEAEDMGASYRDRAEERRKDQNPDYVNTATEMGTLNAVGPPGTADFITGEAHRISIENSKYLGGDLEHTHLVKGLDYALLQKVRSELEQKQEDEGEDKTAREKREEKAMNFRTPAAKVVYQQLVKPQVVNKVNEMFLKGRTLYVFDMDEEFAHEMPTTVVKSKEDCAAPEETVSVSVDSAVLERISRIMAYLRLGSSGKALKKKKKERDNEKVLIPGVVPSLLGDGPFEEEETKPHHLTNGNAPSTTNLPPPPPLPCDEEDIFVGSGTDYKVEIPQKKNKDETEGEKKEEWSPRQKPKTRGERGGRNKYFEQSSGLEEFPAPPSLGESMPTLPPPPPLPQQWEPGAVQGPSYPAQQAIWEEYPPPPPDGYEGAWPPPGVHHNETDYGGMYPAPYPSHPGEYPAQIYPEATENTWYGNNSGASFPGGHMATADGLAPVPPPGDPYPLGDPRASGDPKFMSQEEKDRGLGSVFRRDDNRLIGKKEADMRERDPAFISESYSECYPDYRGFTREIVESDDEEDLSKMDQGSKAKGRLHQWDFETEEEWTKYNESKEAMPKAAFQFGVKTVDGRKTRKSGKDKEQKLNNELHQITKLIDRKKKERSGPYDDDNYVEDTPGKKMRL